MGRSRADLEKTYLDLTGEEPNEEWTYNQLQKQLKALAQAEEKAEAPKPAAEAAPKKAAKKSVKIEPEEEEAPIPPLTVGAKEFSHMGEKYPLKKGRLHAVLWKGSVRYLSELSIHTIRGRQREHLELPQGSMITLRPDTSNCATCGQRSKRR